MVRLFFFLFFLPLVSRTQTAPILIRDVNIVDVEKGRIKRHQTVLIEDGRIKTIGLNVPLPKHAEVVNGTDQYLMPGLWDMHFHMRDNIEEGWQINEKVSLPLLLANGVTGVRYMAGNAGLLAQRKRVEQNQLLGPRMVVYSPMFTGRASRHTRYHFVRDTVQARRSVDSFYRLGYDGIKIYTCFPDRAVFFAVADQANKRGMPFGGHVPATVTAAEAAMAGMRSLEHTHGVREGYASNEKVLVAMNSDVCITRRSLFNALDSITTAMVTHFDKKAGDALAGLFRSRNVHNVPTQAFLNFLEKADKTDSLLAADTLYHRYTPLPLKTILMEEHVPPSQIPVITTAQKKENAYNVKVVHHLYRSGAPMLIGTDAPMLTLVPGFSLHQEMEYWVNTGIPPSKVLRAATMNAAAFLGWQERLGSVKQGKEADLLLLEGNPLLDIRNTRKIAAVFIRGRLLLKKELENMLNEAERLCK
ncbi:MAG TPA: amidohydrolase family protein [Chitinophagaceae bacterium]|jgi:imidazolonepropionase-like amidohydrolase|nr:amidohydrolase family protein [Chitinophagaceae bacterium]